MPDATSPAPFIRMQPSTVLAALSAFLAFASIAHAQSIQPVVVEYQQKADGRIDVVNDTLYPMAVVLEPKSFTISEEGRGIYRALDPSIHLKLSTSSFWLGPRQTYYVFYKASAETLPAWFTIYAALSPIQGGKGLKFRYMLPHTVYLYQKQPVDKTAIHVGNLTYNSQDKKINCDIRNEGSGLVRVQEVRATAGRLSVLEAGFPLLPGGIRHLSIDWTDHTQPEAVLLQFPHFQLQEPLASSNP